MTNPAVARPDGAAGCVVSRVPAGFRLIASHHITNGALVHAGDDETVGVYFSYTHRLVTELLARVGRVASDVAWVVPQNTNLAGVADHGAACSGSISSGCSASRCPRSLTSSAATTS